MPLPALLKAILALRATGLTANLHEGFAALQKSSRKPHALPVAAPGRLSAEAPALPGVVAGGPYIVPQPGLVHFVEGNHIRHVVLEQKPDNEHITRYMEADRVLQASDPEAEGFLDANSRTFVDLGSVGLVALVVVLTLLGRSVGKAYSVPSMILASYLILIPGLFYKDFSFSIVVLVRDYAATLPVVQNLGIFSGSVVNSLPKRLLVTSGITGGTEPVQESTRSLVKLLWDTGSHTGAICMALFAFVVPALKLFCLGLAGTWGNHPSPARVRTARHLIFFVQMISKWASPDMYVFALLYYLLRTLHKPPLTESLVVLDFGFSCYNIFCVASVVSTLFVELPPMPQTEQEEAKKLEDARARKDLLQRFGGRTILPVVALANFVAWAVLFFFGLFQPVISMRLDSQGILGHLNIDESMMGLVKQFVDVDSLEKLVSADVSLWQATTSFWGWAFEMGDVTLVLGFLMLGVFCIFMTILDMCLLLSVAFLVGSGAESRRFVELLMKVVTFTRHLSFVDVAMVGCFVVKFAAAVYASQGVIMKPEHGVWILLGTEVLHYATYFFVGWGVQVLEDDGKDGLLPKDK